MKRILVNATQPEELRVALVDGQKLFDLDIEVPSTGQKKANVYKGKISRVEPSLEAAFVDYGAERHGFLPMKEISREYFKKGDHGSRPNIKDVIKEGQEVIVQVEKDERGNKGAALTTFVSLAGRYLVLMPNSPRAGGVSRRIEGEDRTVVRDAMRELEIEDGMGIIVRTAGVGRQVEELQWDLDRQADIWGAVTQAAETLEAPALIYQESNVIIRALRDYLRDDIGEVLIDEPGMLTQATDFMNWAMPQSVRKLKLYQDEVPLFARYQIESQIETAFNREVTLPSGGALVIDHTEALVSIDINSARSTGGRDIEATALNTNLEAADEIARQLRLRDLGGLVVIDFIDMSASKNQREVENRVRDALKTDRARVQVGRISRFGLLEMSRQRLRPSLGDSHGMVCPRCTGQGTIRGVNSLSLSVLRLMEEAARKERTGRVTTLVPVDVGTFLLNEKREAIADLEKRTGTEMVIIPTQRLETPHFSILRVRDDEVDTTTHSMPSYQQLEAAEKALEEIPDLKQTKQPILPPPPVAAVTPSTVVTPAPQVAPAPTPAAEGPSLNLAPRTRSVWAAIVAFFLGSPEARAEAKKQNTKGQDKRQGKDQGRGKGRNDNNRNNSGNNSQRGGRNQQTKGRGGRDDRNDKNERGGRGNKSQQKGTANQKQGKAKKQDGRNKPNDNRGDQQGKGDNANKQQNKSQGQNKRQQNQRGDRNQNNNRNADGRNNNAAESGNQSGNQQNTQTPAERNARNKAADSNNGPANNKPDAEAAVVATAAVGSAAVANTGPENNNNGPATGNDDDSPRRNRNRRGRRGGRRRNRPGEGQGENQSDGQNKQAKPDNAQDSSGNNDNTNRDTKPQRQNNHPKDNQRDNPSNNDAPRGDKPHQAPANKQSESKPANDKPAAKPQAHNTAADKPASKPAEVAKPKADSPKAEPKAAKPQAEKPTPVEKVPVPAAAKPAPKASPKPAAISQQEMPLKQVETKPQAKPAPKPKAETPKENKPAEKPKQAEQPKAEAKPAAKKPAAPLKQVETKPSSAE